MKVLVNQSWFCPSSRKAIKDPRPYGHAPDAAPIALSQQVEIGRLGVDRIGDGGQHNCPWKQIDVEYHLPSETVCQQTADVGSDRRPQCCGYPEQCQTERTLARRQHRISYCERDRDHDAPGKTLQRAVEHHLS
jgi:hypothetical protein